MADIEIGFDQMVDEMKPQFRIHGNVHIHIAVTPGRISDDLRCRLSGVPRNQAHRLAPADGEEGHVVVEEHLLLFVADNHHDIGVGVLQRFFKGSDGLLVGIMLGLKFSGVKALAMAGSACDSNSS